MNLSDISVRRPVLATVISLLLVVLGVMSFTRLTLRELPAIDPRRDASGTSVGQPIAAVSTRSHGPQ